MQAAALLTVLPPQTSTAARSGTTGDAAVDAPDFGHELQAAKARADEYSLPVVTGSAAPVAGRATPRGSIVLDKVPGIAETPAGVPDGATGPASASTSKQENIPPDTGAAPPTPPHQDPDAPKPRDPFRVTLSTASVLSTPGGNSLLGHAEPGSATPYTVLQASQSATNATESARTWVGPLTEASGTYASTRPRDSAGSSVNPVLVAVTAPTHRRTDEAQVRVDTNSSTTTSTDTLINTVTNTGIIAAAIPSPQANAAGFTDPLHALPQRLARLAANGVETTRVDLDIASADTVEVRMTLQGNQVRVDMTSDNPHVRERLEEALPAVAAALHTAGLKLVDGGIHARLPDASRADGRSEGAQRATASADVDADPMLDGHDASAAARQDVGLEVADATLEGMSFTNDLEAPDQETLRGSSTVARPEPRFDSAAASLTSAGEATPVTSGQRAAQFADAGADAGADRIDRTAGTAIPPTGPRRGPWAEAAGTQILSSGRPDMNTRPQEPWVGQATAATTAERRIAAERRADVRPTTPTATMSEAVASRAQSGQAPMEITATSSGPVLLQQKATGSVSSSALATPPSTDSEASETVRASTNVDEVAPTRVPTRQSGPNPPAPAPAADAAYATGVLETPDTSMHAQRATQINVRPVTDEGTNFGAGAASRSGARTENTGWREVAISPRESTPAPAARAALTPTQAEWINVQALPAGPGVTALMGVVPEGRAQRAGSPPSANDSPRAAGRAAASRRETLLTRTDPQTAAMSLLPALTAQPPTPVPGLSPESPGGAFNASARTPDMTVMPPSREPDMSGEAAGQLPAATTDTTFSAALELAGSALPEFMLREALESPDFVPALSARVATLVRDGIEEARIQLNPAEMGPVAVQLALEGSDVRVDLAAEMESTRQILEQSLPSLASALRESGFTLTGGGVFQQSRDSDGDDRGQARSDQRAAGRTSNESITTVTPAGTNRTSHRGLVDLYA